MRRLLLAALLIGGCAPGFHEGRTTLGKPEQANFIAGQTKRGALERIWVAKDMKRWGLLRWDADRSGATQDAPPELLQTLRDELGRLNASAGTGKDAYVSALVFRYDRGGLFSHPTAHYELAVRDKSGRLLWAAIDRVEARPDLARTLADTPSQIIAREILRRVRALSALGIQ